MNMMQDITYMKDGDKAYLPSSIISIEDDAEWREAVAVWLLRHAETFRTVAVVERRGDDHVFAAFNDGDYARVVISPPYEGDAVTLRFARGWHSVD